MKVYSYIVEHDLGFAPNPFHGVCSLACCKPRIRKRAKVGEYVLGVGGARPKLRGHLIYWMRIDEILTFDQYWADRRFRHKKALVHGTTYLRYGDNIYHRHGGIEYRQENSFHSNEDGSISRGDLKRDTGTTDRVLLGREFAFWGRSAMPVPAELACFLRTGRDYRSNFEVEEIEALLTWLAPLPRGYLGEPADWQFLGSKKRGRARKKAGS